MNVWLVTIGEQLPIKAGVRKLRTAYLADELLSRGHAVVWWTSAFDHFKKQWLFTQDTEVDINPYFKIKLLKGCGYKKNISLKRFLDHRLLTRKFKKMAGTLPKPDIIITSMPAYDLSNAAVAFAEAIDVPVLVDIRDQWPDIFLDKSPLPKKITRLMLAREFSILEKVMRKATGIISVSEGFMSWGLNYAGRQKSHADKVFYLGYKKNNGLHVPMDNEFQQIINKIKNKFVVVFIGTFEAFHDPSILLDCAKILQNDEKIHFILAGDGKLNGEIRKKAHYLENVTLTGWLDQGQIDVLLSSSDVGVCTSNQPADLFPNKAFAYFAHGLPMLSSFEGDLKEILDEEQVGFYYPANDVDQLIEKINLLKNSELLYKQYCDRANSLFAEKFDGEKIYSAYADHIEGFVMKA